MTANPLRAVAASSSVRSGKTAREWAQIARDRGDAEGAAAWEAADRDGWDDMHFDPGIREQHVKDAGGWAGKRGLLTNRFRAA